MLFRFRLFLFLVLLIISCAEEDTLTPEEKATILISKTWVTGSVILDTEDITDFGYRDFELTFEPNGQWLAVNGGDVFGNSGTWEFVNKQLTSIRLSDITASINLNPQGRTLQLQFLLSGEGPINGRQSSTTGEYSLYLLPKYPDE